MAARRLHVLVYLTILLCILSIIICGIALGTNHWFKSKANAKNSDGSSQLFIEVSYGLFKGTKVKLGGVSTQTYDIRVVCQASDNKCMYSCGTTSALRKKDLEQLISTGIFDESICRDAEIKSLNLNTGELKAEVPEQVYQNFAFFVITIVFIAMSIAFSALAAVLALYNTYRTPIQPILSVLGLYIWNGVSASCVALAMIFWGITFATSLNKNAAISDTLDNRGIYQSNGNGSLGWSFWILILAFISSAFNIGILKYRSWKIIQMEAKNVRVMNTKLDSGDILLF